MANRVCWNCGTKSHQAIFGKPTKAKGQPRFFLSFVCDECGVASIGELRGSGSDTLASAALKMGASNASLTWHPVTPLGKDFPDVPQHVSAAASEAHMCHSVSAYRAAILLARAVVEATAKDKGVSSGNLAAKIDELEKQSIVRELVKDTAHEIRFIGNDMAHGDFVAPVDETDSADVLAFMDEILNEVYQAPARMNARRATRQAKKAPPTP